MNLSRRFYPAPSAAGRSGIMLSINACAVRLFRPSVESMKCLRCVNRKVQINGPCGGAWKEAG
jgi:hypothetical protein